MTALIISIPPLIIYLVLDVTYLSFLLILSGVFWLGALY